MPVRWVMRGSMPSTLGYAQMQIDKETLTMMFSHAQRNDQFSTSSQQERFSHPPPVNSSRPRNMRSLEMQSREGK